MNSNDKWRPENSPELKQEFEGKKPEDQGEKIATKRELERLNKERENPVQRLDYLPFSQSSTILQERMGIQREKRIKDLQTILGKYQNRARDDFNRNSDNYLIKQDKDKGLER